jgi:hypothetical protein
MSMEPRAAMDPAHTSEHIHTHNHSDTGRVACPYARWVHVGAAGAPHLGVPLPTRVHQDLMWVAHYAYRCFMEALAWAYV